MSIKLVVLDLDGTTLDSAGNLPDINKKALEEAITKGIKIVIAIWSWATPSSSPCCGTIP